jgi:hypothetical protein
MKHLFKLALGILFCLAAHPSPAQVPLPGGLPPGLPHALLDVVGDRPAFYGKATIEVASGADGNFSTFDCNVAVLGGNMRLEVNNFQPASNAPPYDATQLAKMHMIDLLHPDQNRMYVIFPMLKSYLETTYGPNTGTAPVALPTIVKTALPKATIGDLACEQSQWSVSDPDGEHHDLTVWTATNYANFPIQIKLLAPPALVKFQDIQMQAPDASLFDLPVGYSKYEGIQELILTGPGGPKHTNSP